MASTPKCWCGNRALLPFSPDYLRCGKCETLVLARFPEKDPGIVSDDEHDLYGRGYFTQHLSRDYGQPGFDERVRADLPERNLFWLETLLRFTPPKGRLLELGCFHGGFVALARLAGFDAVGLELSPTVCRRARKMFGVEVLEGRIEAQDLPPSSFDAIAHFDVLEHLWDPLATLKHCGQLMSPGGFMLIQTPCYPAGVSHEQLVTKSDPFLTHLKPVEHLYLFSKRSIGRILARAGLVHQQFEPAIFAHYDMFLAASTAPLRRVSEKMRDKHLAASPGGRTLLALLDIGAKRRAAEIQFRQAHEERSILIGRLAENQNRLDSVESDRTKLNALARSQAASHAKSVASLEKQIASLNEAVRARDAKLVELDRELGKVNRIAREQAKQDSASIATLEKRVASLASEVAARDAKLAEIDADRARVNKLAREQAAASAASIAALEKQIAALNTDAAAREKRLAELDRQLADVNSTARKHLKEHDAAAAALQKKIAALEAEALKREKQLADTDTDRARVNKLAREQAAASAASIAALEKQIAALNTDATAREKKLAEVDLQLADVNATARKQLEERDAAATALQKKIAVLEADALKREKLLADTDADRTRVNTLAREQLAEHERLEAQLLSQIAELRFELEARERRLAEIDADRAKVNEIARTQEAEIARLQETIAGISAELETSRQTAIETGAALASALRSESTYRGLHSAAEGALFELERNRRQLEAQLASLETSILHADSANSELAGELGRTAEATRRLAGEREALQARAAVLSKELADSQAAAAASDERNRALAKELAELQSRRWTRLGGVLRAIPRRSKPT